MRTVRTVVAALVLLSVHGASSHLALAADADALAAEGLRLRREGKDQNALPLFQEALRQQPTPRASGQLGFCEQALGLWVAAEAHILESLKQGTDPWTHRNEKTLRESLAFVQGKLGSIQIWGTPAGARISIDGQVVSTLPIPHPLRASEGRHVMMIEATDFLADTRIVEVRAGALSQEHFALVAAGAVTPPTQPAVPPPAAPIPATPPASPVVAIPSVAQQGRAETELPLWRRVAPWSLLAGAVVVGSVGAWQHVSSRSAQDRFEAIPGCGENVPMRGSDPRCAGLYADLSSARTRAFVGYGIATILGAGAATLFILNATAKNSPNDGAQGIGFGPGHAGLSYAMLF